VKPYEDIKVITIRN